jgi:hypothetical protein
MRCTVCAGSSRAAASFGFEFPPKFPCAPLSGKAIGYVACRAVLRALVTKYIYQWKDNLDDAANESKIDNKIVNMRKKYNMGGEKSHNSAATTAVKRQREI